MKSFFHEKLYAHNNESFSNQANNDIPFSMTIRCLTLSLLLLIY